MKLPRFILGDNTETPDAIFVIHTEYPRFIINLENDELEFWEDLSNEEEHGLKEETETLVKEAIEFYDREVERYQEE